RDCSKRSTGRRDIRPAPVRMIQEIEHLESKLHCQSLEHREILSQTGVRRPVRRAPDAIALLRAEGPRRRLRIGCRVEPKHPCRTETPHRSRTVAYLIPELIATARPYPGNILAGPDGIGRTGLVLVNARDF